MTTKLQVEVQLLPGQGMVIRASIAEAVKHHRCLSAEAPQRLVLLHPLLQRAVRVVKAVRATRAVKAIRATRVTRETRDRIQALVREPQHPESDVVCPDTRRCSECAPQTFLQIENYNWNCYTIVSTSTSESQCRPYSRRLFQSLIKTLSQEMTRLPPDTGSRELYDNCDSLEVLELY